MKIIDIILIVILLLVAIQFAYSYSKLSEDFESMDNKINSISQNMAKIAEQLDIDIIEINE